MIFRNWYNDDDNWQVPYQVYNRFKIFAENIIRYISKITNDFILTLFLNMKVNLIFFIGKKKL